MLVQYTIYMGILGRLGNVVKSYLNDETDSIFGKKGRGSQSRGGNTHDSDLNAAYQELDDFLNGKDSDSQRAAPKEPVRRRVPAEILADFAELGISPEASAQECKAAYKKLLKIHHPDRHAGNPEALKKATEKTTRVNAAYRRIEVWQKK